MKDQITPLELQQQQIKDKILEQIKGLLDLHIEDICKTAVEFHRDEKRFNIGFKSNIDYDNLDAILECSITIPAITLKDTTTPAHFNFRGTDLI